MSSPKPSSPSVFQSTECSPLSEHRDNYSGSVFSNGWKWHNRAINCRFKFCSQIPRIHPRRWTFSRYFGCVAAMAVQHFTCANFLRTLKSRLLAQNGIIVSADLSAVDCAFESRRSSAINFALIRPEESLMVTISWRNLSIIVRIVVA